MEVVQVEEQMDSMSKLMHQMLDSMNNFHSDDHTIRHLHGDDDDADDGGIVIPPFPSDNGRNGSFEMSHSPSGSWETTMSSLAKELETICSRGSSPRDSPNISPCVTPTNGMTTTTTQVTRSQRTVSLASGPLPHQGSLCSGDGGYPTSIFSSPSGARPVRVRHEETEDRLDRSLTMICRQNSPQAMRFLYDGAPLLEEGRGGGGARMNMKRGSALKHRDSSKYGIRFRLDLANRDPDNITVSINVEEHILRVLDDGELIHMLQLAENTDPQTLSCTIIDGNALFIKQRSKEMMCLEYEGSSEVNLPISRQDESQLMTTINLRIPSNVSADDVCVKTIDDTLMIRTSDAASPTSPTSAAPNAHQFWVALSLPEGTDTRSVSAWMTKGRLTIRGRLMATSRRMTCAFWGGFLDQWRRKVERTTSLNDAFFILAVVCQLMKTRLLLLFHSLVCSSLDRLFLLLRNEERTSLSSAVDLFHGINLDVVLSWADDGHWTLMTFCFSFKCLRFAHQAIGHNLQLLLQSVCCLWSRSFARFCVINCFKNTRCQNGVKFTWKVSVCLKGITRNEFHSVVKCCPMISHGSVSTPAKSVN